MSSFLSIDISNFNLSNKLLSQLSEKLGKERFCRAFQEAINLQGMFGNDTTLPVLLLENCGMALISKEALFNHTGVILEHKPMVLLLSTKDKSLQLIIKT